jgi:hypothetical protein
MKESDNDETLFLNSRGVDVHGRIANKIGFAASILDNQERDHYMCRHGKINFNQCRAQGIIKVLKELAMIISMQEVILLLMSQNILMLLLDMTAIS